MSDLPGEEFRLPPFLNMLPIKETADKYIEYAKKKLTAKLLEWKKKVNQVLWQDEPQEKKTNLSFVEDLQSPPKNNENNTFSLQQFASIVLFLETPAGKRQFLPQTATAAQVSALVRYLTYQYDAFSEKKILLLLSERFCGGRALTAEEEMYIAACMSGSI